MENPTTHKDIANIFFKALQEVFETFMDLQIETEAPLISLTERINHSQYSSFIKMHGSLDIDGYKKKIRSDLCFSWDESCLLKIAEAMTGETFDSVSEEVADIGNEISNIVMGNSKKALSFHGYDIGMAIPTFINGTEYSIQHSKGTYAISSKISSPCGPFLMEINYLETD